DPGRRRVPDAIYGTARREGIWHRPFPFDPLEAISGGSVHHGARPDVGGLGAVFHPGGSLGQAPALVWHATEGRLDQLDRRAEHALPALEHRWVLWPPRVAVGQQRPVVGPHRIKTVWRLGESADRNAARK